MSREAMQQALDALELAGNSHGIMLLSDPPQDAWKTRRVDDVIKEAIAALRAALVEQPAAPVLTDAEIDAIIAKAHDGKVYPQSGVLMPKLMRRAEARAILTAAVPPGYCVVKDEPVAWQWRKRNEPWTLERTFNNEVFATTDDSEVRTLYAARSGGGHE